MDVALTIILNVSNIFLYYIFPFIAVIGIMIFFHELGHFLIAKLFHVKVLKFSLGLNKCSPPNWLQGATNVPPSPNKCYPEYRTNVTWNTGQMFTITIDKCPPCHRQMYLHSTSLIGKLPHCVASILTNQDSSILDERC